MKFSNLSILLTDGFTRQSLPMAEAASKLGCRVTIICYSKLDVGFSSRFPVNRVLVDFKKEDDKSLLNKVIEIVKENNINLVIPLTDFSATIFSKNKKILSKITKVAVNEWDTFKLAIDKLNTMEICMKEGIPCPKTLFDNNSIEKVREQEIRFPIVIKPRSACGSIGINKIDSEEKLQTYINNYNNELGPLFIQEYIPQSDIQYNAHIFIDKNGIVKTAMVFVKGRWFPIDGGASTFSYTVENSQVIEICTELLQSINWNGYADIDLIVDPRDGIPKVIEINPRISANVKLCFIAGANIVQQIIENELFSNDVTDFTQYKFDMRMRCLHTDILWFLKSQNRFKYKPSWFSFKNTYDQIFSVNDPIPWVTFTVQSVFKYRKEMKKRERE